MPNKSDSGNVEFRSYCYSEEDGYMYVFDDSDEMKDGIKGPSWLSCFFVL